MDTSELDTSASMGAEPAPQAQTMQPEPQDAEVAHQQDDAGEAADQSPATEEADKGLTEEQRTIRKLQRRIDRLSAKRGAAEREAELLRQQYAEVSRSVYGQQGEEGEPTRVTEADIERIALQRARDIARQQAISTKVSKVLQEGSRIDGFNQAVDAVAEVVPFVDRSGRPTPFIEAVLDADAPEALLKHLGDNPDMVEELAALSPAALGRRLAKLEIQIASGRKQQSAAPTPIRPVSGAASVAKDESRMTDAEWRASRFKRQA